MYKVDKKFNVGITEFLNKLGFKNDAMAKAVINETSKLYSENLKKNGFKLSEDLTKGLSNGNVTVKPFSNDSEEYHIEIKSLDLQLVFDSSDQSLLSNKEFNQELLDKMNEIVKC